MGSILLLLQKALHTFIRSLKMLGDRGLVLDPPPASLVHLSGLPWKHIVGGVMLWDGGALGEYG